MDIIEIQEEVIFNQKDKKIILEKGDRIKVFPIKENYGKNEEIIIKRSKTKSLSFMNSIEYLFELFDGSSSSSKHILLDEEKAKKFQEELILILRKTFDKYN